MKGDFSRSTFRKKKHYRKVKMQQGRVQVDADWNEQIDIQDNYDRTYIQDIIGKSGAPKGNFDPSEDDPSEDTSFKIKPFKITPSDRARYTIGKGRYYVEGLLIENEEKVEASKQPDLLLDEKDESKVLPTENGIYIAYLDVWERHLTALDDPEIQESALGGADTATRSKIVWQVKLHGPIDILPGNRKCSNSEFISQWDLFVKSKSSTGALQARSSKQEITTNDPCMLSPNAGYRRLDNQLYRVEIHDGGEVKDSSEGNENKQVTFKWSRDNGIVATNLTDISFNDKKLTVRGSGKDKLLGFASGQWVEIIDDRNELFCTPGTLVKLTDVNENVLTYDPDFINGQDPSRENFPQKFNPKVRRWDTDTKSKTGSIKVQIITAAAADDNNNDGYIQLEGGVEVKFGIQSGFSTVTFRTGDYWLIPARTTKADIEWPQTENTPILLAPEGIIHHFSPLAILEYTKETETIEVKDDCRKPFPSITSLPTSTTDFRGVNSGIINPAHTIIQDGMYKIIGPYFHKVSNEGPPAIILSETNTAEDDSKINYMEDIVLLSMLNRQYDNHLSEDNKGSDVEGSELSPIKDHPAIEKFFKTDSSIVPVFFKAVSIDKTSFHILLINCNKGQTVGWDDDNDWISILELGQLGVNKIVVGSNKNRLPEVFVIIDQSNKQLTCIRRNPDDTWKQPTIGDGLIDQVIVGSNKDGTFEAFAIKSDNSSRVVYNYEEELGSGDYEPQFTSNRLGSNEMKASQIVVGTNKDGRLEVFAIDKDTNKVSHVFQNNTENDHIDEWSEWRSLDDTVAVNSDVGERIVVGTNKDGRLEVFAIDKDDTKILRHICQIEPNSRPKLGPDGSSGWSKWSILVEGISLVQIKVGTNKDGRLEVFAIQEGTNKVVHIWQNEPNTDNWNSGWVVLGSNEILGSNGIEASQIVVGSNKDGRLEVFAIQNGTDNVFHIWQNEPNTDNWNNSGWVQLGKSVMNAKGIAVGITKFAENDQAIEGGGGRLEVFAIDNNNILYYISQKPLSATRTLNLRWWAIPTINVQQV